MSTRIVGPERSKIPVIALTANAMKDSGQEVLDAGCSGFRTKPINIDQLLQTLAALLGGKRVDAPAPGATTVAPMTLVPTAAPSRENVPSTGVAGAPIHSRLAGVVRLRSIVQHQFRKPDGASLILVRLGPILESPINGLQLAGCQRANRNKSWNPHG